MKTLVFFVAFFVKLLLSSFRQKPPLNFCWFIHPKPAALFKLWSIPKNVYYPLKIRNAVKKLTNMTVVLPLNLLQWTTYSNTYRFRISHFATADEFTDTTIRVITIEKRQYGLYTCKAANKLGQNEAQVELFGQYSLPYNPEFLLCSLLFEVNTARLHVCWWTFPQTHVLEDDFDFANRIWDSKNALLMILELKNITLIRHFEFAICSSGAEISLRSIEVAFAIHS